MTIGNQWFGRTLWALAACVWLGVLPAMAADVVTIARDGARGAEDLLDRWHAHAPLLAAIAHEKGGPAWPDRRIQTCELERPQAADRLPAAILPLRLSRSSS